MLMASAGGVATGCRVHTGVGVARREAYHERRAEERAQLQELNVEELLANELRSNVIRATGHTAHTVSLTHKFYYPVEGETPGT